MTHPRAGSLLAAPSVALAYALMIGAVNLLNPLLPVIQDDLGLAAAELAAIYSVYLFVLVGVLALLMTARLRTSLRVQVLAALGCTALADLLHMVGSAWSIGAGRALLSVSIGVATGAVAQYMVTSIGERGRTTTATANIGGAFLGTGGAGLVVLVSDDPLRPTFVVHLVALAVVGSMVWRFAGPAVPGRSPPTGTTRLAPYRRPSRSAVSAGFLMGGLAWIAAASVIVLAPAAYRDHGGDLTTWVTVLVLGMFASAFAAQYSVGRSSKRFRESAAALVLGMVALASGAGFVSLPLLLAGGVLVGVGYGAVFRMGMARVSRGLDERNQGREASRYAGIAYFASSLSLVGGGVLIDRIGGAPALWILTLVVTTGLLACHLIDRTGGTTCAS